MKIGISSYTFPWAVGVSGFAQPARPMTAIDLVEEARQLGAGVLQFGDNLPLDALSDADINQLKITAARGGIAIEVGTRGIASETLLTYLGIAKRLNARLVRTLVPRDPSTADIGDTVKQLAIVVPAYEADGVVLAVENYELYSAAEFAAILRMVPSPNLAMCLDTVNNLGRAESIDDLIRAFGARIACLHVKDVRISRVDTRMGFRVEGCPAGEGVVDLRCLSAALRAAGVCTDAFSVIIEQWPPEQADLETTIAVERDWARTSFDNVKRLLCDA